MVDASVEGTLELWRRLPHRGRNCRGFAAKRAFCVSAQSRLPAESPANYGASYIAIHAWPVFIIQQEAGGVP